MRYFLVSFASSSDFKDLKTTSLRFQQENFPVLKELIDLFKKDYPRDRNVTLIGISEMSKEDYETFFELIESD